MTVPAKANQLITFIVSIEAPAGFGTIFGNRQSALKKPLTQMTIDEVLAAQKTWSTKAWARKFKSTAASSAAGGPQFMRATLLSLKAEGKCRGDEPFDEATQRRLAYALLQRRGFDRFVAGKMSRAAFALELAKEWASFPVLKKTQGAHRIVARGQSYYAGDGLNKALVSPVRVEAALAALLGSPAPQQPEQPKPAPAPIPGPEIEYEGPTIDEPQDDASAEKPLSRSTRLWTWLTTGGGTALLPWVDWRVQMLLVVLIVGLAIYAIATMPAVRRKLGLA